MKRHLVPRIDGFEAAGPGKSIVLVIRIVPDRHSDDGFVVDIREDARCNHHICYSDDADAGDRRDDAKARVSIRSKAVRDSTRSVPSELVELDNEIHRDATVPIYPSASERVGEPPARQRQSQLNEVPTQVDASLSLSWETAVETGSRQIRRPALMAATIVGVALAVALAMTSLPRPSSITASPATTGTETATSNVGTLPEPEVANGSAFNAASPPRWRLWDGENGSSSVLTMCESAASSRPSAASAGCTTTRDLTSQTSTIPETPCRYRTVSLPTGKGAAMSDLTAAQAAAAEAAGADRTTAWWACPTLVRARTDARQGDPQPARLPGFAQNLPTQR